MAPASSSLPDTTDVDAQVRRQHVLRLLGQHGWNSTSFQVLESGFEYWFGADACVAYVDTGRAWVAAGAPIVATDNLAATGAAFVAAAQRQGRRAVFFGTEKRFVAASGLRAVQIGQQPIWDPGAWAVTRAHSRGLREQLRRSAAKGVRAREATTDEMESPSSPTRQRAEQLIAKWLRNRSMAPMSFLVQVEPFSFTGERRYFVAECGDELVGFLAAVPVYARRGWLFDDLLRAPNAPNGTVELLVDAAMTAVAATGSPYVTMGLAPLAGASSWLRAAQRLGTSLYNFRGLYAFKAKLRPATWEPIYLVYPRSQPTVLSLLDALAAFTPKGLGRFGLDTVLRGPMALVRLLALLLLPWTVLLASVNGRTWFGWPWLQWFWVGFDVCVMAGFFSLSRRWRPWLATLLAILVSADAVATGIEAVVFREPPGALAWGIKLAALAGPSFAAFVLWRARRQRQ